MEYKNIAKILNESISKNALGENTIIEEDLSNIVELGKLVSEMSSDSLLDFKKKLVVGVHNFIIAREYNCPTKFGLYRNSEEYGSGIQRIMASGNYTAKDSHLLNLVNGQSYLDGKFYGTDLSSKVYTETKAFKVVHSISDDEFKMYFMSATDTANFMSLIAVTERNTIKFELNNLEKRVLNMGIYQALKDNRSIKLLTEFNNKTAQNFTLENIYSDRTTAAYFADFCKGIVRQVKDYISEMNKKYNDGTVTTFTPQEDIEAVFISSFLRDMEFIGQPIVFNPNEFKATSITSWQNNTDSILPSFDECSKISVKDGELNKTYSKICGCIYDKYGMGITTKRDKVTVEVVGTEGFTNFHHHLVNNYYIDTRLAMVTFSLD